MSGLNPFISNGTCYYAPGRRSESSFIPCGNGGIEHQTCCGVGDNCLSSNACFNIANGVTYLAGCSDPDYKDSKCPAKGDLDDLPWTGLVYCNGTSNQWMACNERDKPRNLRQGDFCFCPRESASRRVVFSAPSTLFNIALLPTATGKSIRYENDFVPTVTTIVIGDSPTGTQISTGGAINPTVTSTFPDSQDSQSKTERSDGLSTGAKAGIGVGVAAVALLALAALVLLLMRRRKHAAAIASPAAPREKQQEPGSHTSESGGDGAFAPSSPSSATYHNLHYTNGGHYETGFGAKTVGPSNHHISMVSSSSYQGGATPGTMTDTATPNTPAVSELESHAARPWSMRSELQGSERISAAWDTQSPLLQQQQQRQFYLQNSPSTSGTPSMTPVTPEQQQEQQQQQQPAMATSHYPGFRPYRPPGDPAAASASAANPAPSSTALGMVHELP